MDKREIIKSNNAPEAIGAYSQAVSVSGFLFISGQIPIDKDSNKIVSDDFKVQVKQCLLNISGILKEKKLEIDNIVKITVYLTDLNKFNILNDVFISFFKGCNYPARAAVEVSRLPKDSQVEIDAICYNDN